MRRGASVTIPRRSSATTAPGQGRSWRASVSVVVAVLFALALLAAGCTRDASPPSHQLKGTYIVHAVFPHRNFGSPCKGADVGYPDIQPGTVVRVRDDSTQSVLATATLQGGTLRKGRLVGRDDDCVYSFVMTVPDRDAYRIEVGTRPGKVQFTRSELEKSSWTADLTIGAYTLFGGI